MLDKNLFTFNLANFGLPFACLRSTVRLQPVIMPLVALSSFETKNLDR